MSTHPLTFLSGNSTAAKTLSAPPPESVAHRFNALPTGAKIGIYCAIGGVIAAIFGLWAICCIKHRKLGKKEGAEANAAFEKDTAELLAYRSEMGRRRGAF